MIESTKFQPRCAEGRLFCSVIAIGATMAATSLASGMMAADGASSAGATIGKAGAAGSSFLSGLLDEVRRQTTPWIERGNEANSALFNLMGLEKGGPGALNSWMLKPFDMTQKQVEESPGYQFRKDQGLKAVQNSAASKGLATSGHAMKGAADFATGLASAQWQQDFNNYWANRMNVAGLLTGVSNSGLQAQGQFGQQAAALGGGSANMGMQGAQGQAAGQMGAANAMASGVSNAGSAAGSTMMMSNYMDMLKGSGGSMYGQPQPLGDPLKYQQRT